MLIYILIIPQVIIEALGALVVFIIGSVMASPALVEITWAKEMEKRYANSN